MQNEITILLQPIYNNFTAYLPKFVLALLVLVIGLKLHSIFDNWLSKLFEKKDYDETFERFAQSLLGAIYKIVIIVAAVSIAGIETTSIVAAVAAAGFAIGLALQGSMSNFASGVLIVTFKPIKVGEYIEIKNYKGTVNKIEIFNTTLLTLDNRTIIVPNADITGTILINYSRQKIRRVNLEFSVGYDSDIEHVKKVISDTIKTHHEFVIENDSKKTFIRVKTLGDSAIIFAVRAWCKSSDLFKLKYNLIEDIKNALDKANISIPYKTITVQNKKK